MYLGVNISQIHRRIAPEKLYCFQREKFNAAIKPSHVVHGRLKCAVPDA